MLPAQGVCGSVQPHLPIPRLVHQPTDPIFTRPRQFLYDFSPPLVSQIHTFVPNNPPCKETHLIQPRSSVNGHLSTAQQNLKQMFQHDSNPPPFMPLNQEAKNPPSKPLEQLPEHIKMNGSNMSMDSGANNFQPNGAAPNSRITEEGLMPAVDHYSFYNRLCELFPDIHPPQLQRAYDECGRDFLRTIDNVLYARRLRKSIMAQMAKLRSQQQNQTPNNCCGPDPQQQKDKESGNPSQVPSSHKEKQPLQSPKSYPNAKNSTNVRAKRSRILAYQPPSTPSVNSSKRGSSTMPKCTQTTHGPGSTVQPCMKKASSPPPNVFVHQIDMRQQVGGSGDANLNRKTNQSYIFSYRRPLANTFGTLPQPSSFTNVPISSCGDISSFRPPLPHPMPLPFCTQQYPLPDWCPRIPVQLPHASLETQQQQPEQKHQQDMNIEKMSMRQQPSEQGHLPVDSNLQAPRQNNEPESTEWTLLLKNIMDPAHSVESNNGSDMNNMQDMEANEMFGTINQKKQTNGHFIFKANETPGYTFVPNSLRKHSKDNCNISQVDDTTNAHQAMQLANESMNDSLSEQINVSDPNRNEESGMSNCNADVQINSSASGIMNASRKSSVFEYKENGLQHVGKYIEGAPGIQSDEKNNNQGAREGDFSSSNHLVRNADSLGSRVGHGEQGLNTEIGLDGDDDDYSHLLAI